MPSTGSGSEMRSENVPSTTLRQRIIKNLVAELVEATASTNKLCFSDLTFFCLETKEPKVQVWKSSAKNE